LLAREKLQMEMQLKSAELNAEVELKNVKAVQDIEQGVNVRSVV
jgi:hypothetical protein